MSSVVDKWVNIAGEIENIGTMTHTERLTEALNLKEPDMVPCIPEYELWAIPYAGYNFYETWDDVDKCTDAILKAWCDLRVDAIWPYFCPSHVVDPLLTPEQRKTNYDLRDGKSYVVFNEITHDLDEAIRIFESRPWEKYGKGRLAEHWIPHFDQLLEFKKKTGGKVPIIFALGNPSNVCDWLLGVQNVIKWQITQPGKMHYLFELVTNYALDGLASCQFYADEGIEFACIFGGARTWGPRQIAEYGLYDRIYAEHAASMFKYVIYHFCGNNIPAVVNGVMTYPYAALQFDDKMLQLDWSWGKWCEWVARLARGKMAVGNSPTTQLAVHGSKEQVTAAVKTMIEHVAPYTVPVVLPGCQYSTATPDENVFATVEAARKYGKYPECKNAGEPAWTEAEFEDSLARLAGGKFPSGVYHYRTLLR